MIFRTIRSLRRKLVPPSIDQRIRAFHFWLQKRRFRPRVETFSRYGDTWRFYIGDPVGDAWFRGGWDWPEIDFLRNHVVTEGDVVLECGGHHGEMSSFFARWVGPSGKVIVFDPSPQNCRIIEENFRQNGAHNGHVHEAAVGARDGSLDMTLESNARIAEHAAATRRVQVTHLDAWIEHSPTFLKIDVEGFETEVLKGARAVLETRPKLAIELHPNVLPRFGSSTAEVVNLLSPYNYNLYFRLKGETQVLPYTGSPILAEGHLFALPEAIDLS
ncbi:hypothetical protein BH23BAC4_BH23BAC4_17900 [soil metagenome]